LFVDYIIESKNVDESTNSIADMNSFMGILVFFCIKVHLLLMLSIARSSGILVNRDVTSRETNMSVSRTRLFENKLYKSKLFTM